ncbi:hypothetical protein [Mucilaginibacter agri]|uniref:Uncharacterized protein n=1 Tax=Mucilaginibacter agri TaxID=2695265 RepID=A0A966DV28_9SPHI|nr:hypothetical protein [Mucilaginibacter agri]NCD70149.1 hypothetical protein [Mucilaginibacter agri]
MKKLIAIVLLSIHLFNLGGYAVLYQYFIYKSDKLMNEQISRNMFNVHDLVEVKVPVNMPQITSWTSYQRISGQIQFRQGCYNYVKLKLTRDTMYVMCIPNYEKTRLVSANIIYAKNIEDLPISKKDNTFGKKINLSEYSHFVILFDFTSRPTDITTTKSTTVLKHTSLYAGTPFQPPELLA